MIELIRPEWPSKIFISSIFFSSILYIIILSGLVFPMANNLSSNSQIFVTFPFVHISLSSIF